MAEYYVALDDDIYGPYKLEDLVEFIEPGILVNKDGNDEWHFAEEYIEIKGVLVELGLLNSSFNESTDVETENPPNGFIINDSGELVRIREMNANNPPTGIRVNTSGEILRSTTVNNINTSEETNASNKKGWNSKLIITIIVIIIIVILALST